MSKKTKNIITLSIVVAIVLLIAVSEITIAVKKEIHERQLETLAYNLNFENDLVAVGAEYVLAEGRDNFKSVWEKVEIINITYDEKDLNLRIQLYNICNADNPITEESLKESLVERNDTTVIRNYTHWYGDYENAYKEVCGKMEALITILQGNSTYDVPNSMDLTSEQYNEIMKAILSVIDSETTAYEIDAIDVHDLVDSVNMEVFEKNE